MEYFCKILKRGSFAIDHNTHMNVPFQLLRVWNEQFTSNLLSGKIISVGFYQ